MRLNLFLLFYSILLTFAAQVSAGGNKIEYPENYRNWTHIKSMVIEPGHPLENPFQGLHHIYGNDKAIQGLKEGIYPAGSVLVFDLLKYEKNDKTIQEGERKLLGVMVKDETAYKTTGGWGFEGFAADSKTKRLVGDGGKSCYSCHTAQKNSNFVFSKFRN